LLTTLSTGNRHLNALLDTWKLRCGDRGEPIVLGLLTRLATLRLVFQTLVVKENLLANGPDELFTTIYALDPSILKVRRLSRFECEQFAVWHLVSPPTGWWKPRQKAGMHLPLETAKADEEAEEEQVGCDFTVEAERTPKATATARATYN
jgi:hypothetical protein